MSELVQFSKQDGIGVITINNPPVNALSPGVPEGIAQAIGQLNADGEVKAAVLIGAGRTFVSGADIKGTETVFRTPVSDKTDALASSRVRVGYVLLPNLLAYGTGGAGYGHSSLSVPREEVDINQFGWVAGAGLEYKVWGNFIARAEYLHYDFAKEALDHGFNAAETVDLVRGGLSYKF